MKQFRRIAEKPPCIESEAMSTILLDLSSLALENGEKNKLLLLVTHKI